MKLRNINLGYAHNQRGAVLYIALVMLLLLALLGIIGMRVAGLQERMSADYRNTNIAFQNAEASVRNVEADINNDVWGKKGTYPVDQLACFPTFDPLTWSNSAELKDKNTAQYTRRIESCTSNTGSVKEGGSLTDGKKATDSIYQITVLRTDFDANASSRSVIDTIYIP